jgi:transcriptional regulator with XRE-family HTH domain
MTLVSEPNERLRALREARPSPTSPGHGLSRQELAELVNAWLYRETGKCFEIDANYIGKLERGLIRWPHLDYRRALRAVLGVSSDGDLGFFNPRRRPVTVADVDRHDFLGVMAGVAAASLTGALEEAIAALTPTPLPAYVGVTEIGQVRSAAVMFARWDYSFGGGLVREAVGAQLRWSAGLLNARCPDRLQPSLFAAVGELANVAGFMAFDAYAHTDARRIFTLARGCAEHVQDWHVRARALAHLARQAIWLGDADDGLTHVETALVRADRLTATERASLHTIRARALAKLGRYRETLAAVGAADDAFAHSDPTQDPRWMAYYDVAQHHGDTGHALFDLSVQGARTQAGSRLAYAVAHHKPSYVRSRAISAIKLSSLVMATGDPHQAAQLGERALRMAAPLRSNRATDDMRELCRFSALHSDVSEVANLRERISATPEFR